MRAVAKVLDGADHPLQLDVCDPEHDSSLSTCSSSSPSHLRGFCGDDALCSPRDGLAHSATNQEGWRISGDTDPPCPAEVEPPGTVHTPITNKQVKFSIASLLLENSPNLCRSTPKAAKKDGAGVGLEDSPVKAINKSSSASRSLFMMSPEDEARPMPLDTLLAMESLEHARNCKKTVLFSPLSKRKLAVLEAKQSRLQRFVKSSTYELASAAFIVLNVVFVALETDLRARFVASSPRSAYIDADYQDKIYSFIAANVFSAAFVMDLLLRIHTYRCHFFFGWGNIFDILVVLTAVVEVIVHWYEIFSDTTSMARTFLRKFSMLRIIRLLRVISHTRAVGVIRFIRELRLMVFSLTGTLKSLAWAIVLLFIILLVFGVFFTDGAVTHLIQNPTLSSDSRADLSEHFGTLWRAGISLFMSMSGGEDWGNILAVLKPLPYEYQLTFLGFVTFAILALLNVITAVFVEAAMQVSQNDKELVVLEEMKNKDEFMAIMQQVFEELDTNDSGALSLQEFEKHIEDEKLTAFLKSFDLDVSQVRTLFTLLDVDRTGEVDLDEFVSGCMRLKGGAKSLDMAILKYQVEWIMHNFMLWDKKFDFALQQKVV
jgi:hypothetical protein